jgi:hypothetical protein
MFPPSNHPGRDFSCSNLAGSGVTVSGHSYPNYSTITVFSITLSLVFLSVLSLTLQLLQSGTTGLHLLSCQRMFDLYTPLTSVIGL